MSLSPAWVTTAANDLFNTARSGNAASLATSESVSQFFLCVYRRLFPAIPSRTHDDSGASRSRANITIQQCSLGACSACQLVYHYLCLVSLNLFFLDRLECCLQWGFTLGQCLYAGPTQRRAILWREKIVWLFHKQGFVRSVAQPVGSGLWDHRLFIFFVAGRSCEIVQVSEHTNLGVAAGQRLLLLSGEDLFPGSQCVIVCDGPPTSNRSPVHAGDISHPQRPHHQDLEESTNCKCKSQVGVLQTIEQLRHTHRGNLGR